MELNTSTAWCSTVFHSIDNCFLIHSLKLITCFIMHLRQANLVFE